MEDDLAQIAPPVPEEPEMLPVHFVDRDSGLWLSYDNYRALETNIIRMKEYAAKLRTVIEFYQGE